MERHIQICLHRASFLLSSIATLILLLLYLRTPQTCLPNHSHHLRFPRSSCDHSHREHLPLPRKNHRLWSTRAWSSKLSSLTALFSSLRDLSLLSNSSHALCVSAGAGHEAMALRSLHVREVTAVELLESPPLVRRADPHNLPFFDGVFDVAFTAHLGEALFPGRYAAEMERVVAVGGACVVVVEGCDEECVRWVVKLFGNSRLVQAKRGSLIGSKATRIIMKRVGDGSSI